MEFEKLNGTRMKVAVPNISKWKPPPEDTYKINTDGTYDQKTRKGGWGFVIRDKHGDLLASGAGNIKYAASALHAEAMAVNRGILYASQMGMTRIIIEMDNTVLAYSLKRNEIDRSAVGSLVHQARDLMRFEFSYCNVSICNRCCNKVTDCLASYGHCVLSSGSELLMTGGPEFVSDLATGDLPGW